MQGSHFFVEPLHCSNQTSNKSLKYTLPTSPYSLLLEVYTYEGNMLPTKSFFILLILAFSSAAAVKADQLRGDTSKNNSGNNSFLDHILRQLFIFDKDRYEYQLQAGLKKRIGFVLGGSRFKATEAEETNRDLRADNSRNDIDAPEYTFTPCADEHECDSTIATYTRDEVYNEVSSVLKQFTNVPYCLTADPSITKDMYGSCGVAAEDCACAFCLFGSWCLFEVCDSQCYDLSGVDTE